MKNSVSILDGDRTETSKPRNNGAKVQPTLRARAQYGARLHRIVRFNQNEIGQAFRLTSVRRSLAGLRCLE